MADMLQSQSALKMQRDALAQAKAAQEEQRALLAEERARVAAVEEGQRRARQGGKGLLAFSEPLGG